MFETLLSRIRLRERMKLPTYQFELGSRVWWHFSTVAVLKLTDRKLAVIENIIQNLRPEEASCLRFCFEHL
jgi:hypothetical protein